MLNTLRNRASSTVVKLLFVVLIASFAIWGIGDMVRGISQPSGVASVGDVTIEPNELTRQFNREMERARPLLGQDLTTERGVQLGLVDRALQGLVVQALYRVEAEELGLAVSDVTLRKQIQDLPAFHNQSGVFDRELFARVLTSNGLSEDQFVRGMRGDMERQQLVDAALSGVAAPKTLVDALVRYRDEHRVAQVLKVPAAAMPAPAAPTEEELAAYHKAHERLFMAPEYRAVSYVYLTADDLADEVAISDEKLRAAYQDRLDEFDVPERRTIEQMRFNVADRAKAEQALTLLKEGRAFAAVAKEVADLTPEQLALGTLSRDEFPLEAAADEVFSLGQGETTGIIESPLGLHILRVVKIEPAHRRSFDEVKEELRKELAHDAAFDALVDLTNRLDDALAGGSTLEEAAAEVGATVYRVEALDRNGNTPSGSLAADLPPGENFLSTVFETAVGEQSLLTESDDGGYFVLRVDGSTPAAVRPLDSVRDQVRDAILGERRMAAAKAKADAIAERIRGGTVIADVAKAEFLLSAQSQPFTRDGRGAGNDLPLAAVAELFEVPVGGVTVTQGEDGYVVAQLSQVQPAQETAAQKQALGKQLRQGIANDILTQLTDGLRGRHKPQINQGAVARLFSQPQ